MRKVLIANRGEIAVRLIRACRKLELETVAIYSTVDQNALHVELADEAICIGPGPAHLSYLNMKNILSAAMVTHADAIHPGYGFLAENAKFAHLCERMNITFIGPRSKTIEAMGNKYNAKKFVENLGIPTIAGSKSIPYNLTEAEKIAKQLNFPIILKAVAGGGGKGMRKINDEADLKHKFTDAKREAYQAFSDDRLYIEQIIESAHHIEVQILGDGQGRIWTFPERECSLQRNHQKVMEEAPSPSLSETLRQKIIHAARLIGEKLAYLGLGTVEFLVDEAGHYFFIEMNTRVQVEHPVTEMVTGVNLIEEHLALLLHQTCQLPAHSPAYQTALEVRVVAEDPERQFFPSTGTITALSFPEETGNIRIDSALKISDAISPYYDSLLAKVLVAGARREEVLRQMQYTLQDFHIAGVKTDLPLLFALLNADFFQEGDYNIMDVENLLEQKEAIFEPTY